MTKKQITFLADEATVAELDYLTRLSTTTRSELIRTLVSKEYRLDLLNTIDHLPSHLQEALGASSDEYVRNITKLLNTPPAQFLTYKGLTGEEAVRSWSMDHPENFQN